MLGHWRDYQELEESLSLDELLVTLDAIRAREKRNQVFLAAIQGIDLGEHDKKADTNFEEVWANASGADRSEEGRFKRLGIAMVNDIDGD